MTKTNGTPPHIRICSMVKVPAVLIVIKKYLIDLAVIPDLPTCLVLQSKINCYTIDLIYPTLQGVELIFNQG
jgi:hypothetical protein